MVWMVIRKEWWVYKWSFPDRLFSLNGEMNDGAPSKACDLRILRALFEIC